MLWLTIFVLPYVIDFMSLFFQGNSHKVCGLMLIYLAILLLIYFGLVQHGLRSTQEEHKYLSAFRRVCFSL